MRMRYKPWAKAELDACPYFVRRPEEYRGKWHSLFRREQPVELELGCGKGYFIAGAAPANPQRNYIGIDLKDTVLGPARRIIEKAFQEAHHEPDNVILAAMDIERLADAMGPLDSVCRIDINFCNPWPKPRHHKRRLTYPKLLTIYRSILEPEGELFFKTDDDDLFRDTLGYLKEAGFDVTAVTHDLHGDNWPGNILTEHEIMFLKKGIKIKALRARVATTPDIVLNSENNEE